MEGEKVNASEIYHKLGKLEGVIETLHTSLSGFTAHIQSVEDRLVQRQTELEGRTHEWRISVDRRLVTLEKTDANNEGGMKVSGWIVTAIAVPLVGALLSLALTLAPNNWQKGGPGYGLPGHGESRR